MTREEMLKLKDGDRVYWQRTPRSSKWPALLEHRTKKYFTFRPDGHTNTVRLTPADCAHLFRLRL